MLMINMSGLIKQTNCEQSVPHGGTGTRQMTRSYQSQGMRSNRTLRGRAPRTRLRLGVVLVGVPMGGIVP